MAVDHAPKHKRCRALGMKICTSAKCPVTRRNYPPGQHGPTKRVGQKLSTYAIQLREKQKAKWYYGILERQFRGAFERAAEKKGDTSVFLVQNLETRLDNVVYRLGFAATRPQARQLVGHGFITVNGKRVDIASYSVKPGDLIAVYKNKADRKMFQDLETRLQKTTVPSWLLVDVTKKEGKVLAKPEGEDLRQIYDPKMIVELYSR